jgi:hypothetical protein
MNSVPAGSNLWDWIHTPRAGDRTPEWEPIETGVQRRGASHGTDLQDKTASENEVVPQRSRNEKSAPQTTLAQSRRRRVTRSLGKGHV